MNFIDIREPYCVIGHVQGTSNQCRRTWYSDVERASRHAAELLRRPDNVRKNVTELYVVRVDRVVRLAARPVEILQAAPAPIVL